MIKFIENLLSNNKVEQKIEKKEKAIEDCYKAIYFEKNISQAESIYAKNISIFRSFRDLFVETNIYVFKKLQNFEELLKENLHLNDANKNELFLILSNKEFHKNKNYEQLAIHKFESIFSFVLHHLNEFSNYFSRNEYSFPVFVENDLKYFFNIEIEKEENGLYKFDLKILDFYSASHNNEYYGIDFKKYYIKNIYDKFFEIIKENGYKNRNLSILNIKNVLEYLNNNDVHLSHNLNILNEYLKNKKNIFNEDIKIFIKGINNEYNLFLEIKELEDKDELEKYAKYFSNSEYLIEKYSILKINESIEIKLNEKQYYDFIFIINKINNSLEKESELYFKLLIETLSKNIDQKFSKTFEEIKTKEEFNYEIRLKTSLKDLNENQFYTIVNENEVENKIKNFF